MIKSKTKHNYYCQNCGAVYGKWMGKCPDCNSWNSFLEEAENISGLTNNAENQNPNNAAEIEFFNLDEPANDKTVRILTKMDEIDRVLGGGLVKGSAVLIAGDPGVGKSTLLLQMSFLLNQNNKVFYVSGEESVDQIRIRAKRLGFEKGSVKIASATNVFNIIKTAGKRLLIRPDLKLAHSRCIDDHSSGWDRTQLTMSCRMSTLAVCVAYRAGLKMIVAQ